MNAKTAICATATILLTIGSGCARTHLYYDAREMHHKPVHERQRTQLQKTIVDRLQGRNVVWIDAAGRENPVEVSARGVQRLPMAEQVALWLATSTGERGGEHDLRVRLAGKGGRADVPVTVLSDLEGNVVVRSAPQEKRARTDGAPTLDQIRSQFRIARKFPGRWQSAERSALRDALAELAPRELEVMRGLRVERQEIAADRKANRAALYWLRGCDAGVILYAAGVRSDRYRFVGDVDDPRDATLHSLIHEVGHAFEQELARRAFCRAQKARGARAAEWQTLGKGYSNRSPVLQAYLDVLQGAPAPTDYGKSSPKESFAESFALFHVDPNALRRTRPAVHDWFAGGGHIAVFDAHAGNTPGQETP